MRREDVREEVDAAADGLHQPAAPDDRHAADRQDQAGREGTATRKSSSTRSTGAGADLHGRAAEKVKELIAAYVKTGPALASTIRGRRAAAAAAARQPPRLRRPPTAGSGAAGQK